MTLLNQATGLRENKVCEVIEEFDDSDEEVVDLAAELKDEEDENQIMSTSNVKKEKEEDNFTGVKVQWRALRYSATMILQKQKITDPNFAIELELNKDLVLKGSAVCEEAAQPSEEIVKRAEIELVKNQIFGLLQKIQKPGATREDKKGALERLKGIDRSLLTKHEDSMKMKNRKLKKEL